MKNNVKDIQNSMGSAVIAKYKTIYNNLEENLENAIQELQKGVEANKVAAEAHKLAFPKEIADKKNKSVAKTNYETFIEIAKQNRQQEIFLLSKLESAKEFIKELESSSNKTLELFVKHDKAFGQAQK
jgi:ribosomal protein S21